MANVGSSRAGGVVRKVLLPLVAGLTVVTLLGAGAGAGAQPRWRAPSDPLIRAVAAGLVPETHESLQHHVHSHLDVYVDGVHQTVPAGIGIQIDDPGVKNGVVNGSPAYGGIRECAQPCISPLHTHDVSGVLHTESAKNIDNTLGQFFTEWGVPLSAKCVGDFCAPKTKIAVYVGGKKVAGDPSAIPLTDHKEIAIVIGKAPRRIPSTADFSNS